jgi:hypothetical protein
MLHGAVGLIGRRERQRDMVLIVRVPALVTIGRRDDVAQRRQAVLMDRRRYFDSPVALRQRRRSARAGEQACY